MSLTVQNLRAVGPGVEPASLLPGQLAFNITDKVLYVGDGSNFKTQFDGTQVAGTPGEGWYAMPMDFDSLGEYYVANPGYYGDVPTDQQVLAWSTALNHPIWITGTGGGGSQVYIVTNTQVASAPGATTSAKITAAIGVASPDEGNVTIVTGLPDDVYEGLYFFTTEWVKGAAYAYPSATEVIYDNTVTGLTPTVQGAIDDLDAGLTATTAIANTANSTANSALSIANAALPRAGGVMTGAISTQALNVQPGFNVSFTGAGAISFNGGASGTLDAISSSTSSSSATTAASSAAVQSAYLLAQAALPYAGGLMTGTITFATGQVFPVSGIQDATTSQKGVVQVGTNIDVAAGVISVKTATATDLGLVSTGANVQNTAGSISVLNSSTTQRGVVQLVNNTSTSTTDQALTAAMGASLQTQISGITISGTVTLAGSIDAGNGLLQSVTTLGTGAGFSVGNPLPTPAAGNDNYYVIVTAPGTFTPPGPGGAVTSENGDWILSDGVMWQELEVGARPAYATTAVAGVVVLADDPATQAGTDGTLAVTPLSLQSKVSDSTSLTSSTFIASSTAVKAAYDIGAAAIPCSTITAVGDIVVGGAGSAPTALPVGTNGQVLIANSACATGLEWVSDTPGDVTSVTGTAPITVDNFDAQNPVVGVDVATTTTTGVVSVGSNLTVDLAGEINVDTASTTVAGIVQLNDTVTSTSTTEAATANATKTAYDEAVIACGIAQAAVPCASFTAPGELLAGTGAGVYAALPVGADGQVLLADSLAPEGLAWGNACYVPDTCFTAAGEIIVGTGAGTYVALPVGGDGQLLVADSTCLQGVKWGGIALCAYTCTTAPRNTAIGAFAGDSITSGTDNVSVGFNAGTSLTTGVNNTLVGSCAGDNMTTGGNNTVVGQCAMGASTTGTNNVALGYVALGYGNGGSDNTAIGIASGANLSTGFNNVLVGRDTGLQLSTGNWNTFVGFRAGCANNSGTCNTIIGGRAGDAQTSATNNTFLGANAGGAVTLGGTNILLGSNAGCAITTGFNNTVIGDVAGTSSMVGELILAAGTTIKFQANNSGAWSPDGANFGTVGQVLTSQGTVAAPAWCTLSLACVPCAAFVACGDLLVGTGSATFTALPTGANSQVLTVDTACTTTGGLKWATPSNLCGYTNTVAPLNTALGFQAGDSITSGTDNVTIGYNAGTAITTGSQNVIIGSNTSVSSNAVGIVAIGFCAGQANTTGGCVVHIGWVSGRNSTGLNNTYVGSLTGCAASNTSACGTFLGFCAGSAVTSGNGNTFLGHQTGRLVTTGNFNVAVGVSAFQSATTGACNIAIGCGALSGSASGAANVAIGHRAMLNATSAANNVAIGLESGVQLSTGSNNTFVGHLTGDTVTTGVQNTFLGACAGGVVATNSEGNTAVGFSALGQGVTSGGYNVAVGNSAGQSVTSGGGNTFVGFQSGAGVTTGIQNTFMGRYGGTAAMSNNVVLADGAGTVRFQANATGAWAPNGVNFGTAGQVLKSAGTSAAPAWSSALYGAFSDSSIQTNDDLVNGNAVTLDTTASSNGFSIVSGSQITATTAGVYNIQISLQFEKTDAGTDTVEVWFKKNGADIANSNTNIELSGNGAKQLFALNLVEPLTAGQYLEVWWYSADANVQLTAVAAGTRPAIPSAIVTIVPVGA